MILNMMGKVENKSMDKLASRSNNNKIKDKTWLWLLLTCSSNNSSLSNNHRGNINSNNNYTTRGRGLIIDQWLVGKWRITQVGLIIIVIDLLVSATRVTITTERIKTRITITKRITTK